MNNKSNRNYKTKILTADDNSIALAAEYIRNGELVAIPTETVYGLAANGLDEIAVPKIFKAKGRPQDNPLILHIAEFSMMYELAKNVPNIAVKLAERFWPGPLTIILPKSDIVPSVVTAGLDSVAIRFPEHDKTRKLIKMAGVPLAAPSANLSGSPSPTTAEHVYNDLCGKIPLILDGGACSFGLESTVISVLDDKVCLLRPGAITPEDFFQAGIDIEIDSAIFNPLQENQTPSSPGMKYRHYAPKANVILVEGSFSQFCNYVNERSEDGKYLLVFSGEEAAFSGRAIPYGKTPEEQAQELFAALRKLDEIGAKTVYVRSPSPEGIGLAVYNRLLRAASFEVVRL